MPPLRVLLASSEVAPFAKTGGLADVTAALTRYLHKAGHEPRIVLPLYKRVRTSGIPLEPVQGLQEIPMQCGDRRLTWSAWSSPLPKSEARAWFIRCPDLYEREGIYATDGDEHLRFAFLTRVALESCQYTRWAPDVVHVHDWHTALAPLYLRTVYGWDKLFAKTRTLLTLHNNAYQGNFPIHVLRELNLENERKLLWQEDVKNGMVSFLKSGITYATAISTVSRTYAKEIQGDELGMGLQGMLKDRDDHLFGILNGVDYDVWNPATDTRVPHRYTPDDLSGKARMKAALLKRMELPATERAPVLGIVSRLTAQKGFDLLHDSLAVFLQREDIRIVVQGSGEERYEKYFEWLANAFPTKVAYRKAYDEDLAHWIEAGSDMFLMPSRFEPCGLNQMYSLKYGTAPIVRRTGGLADTVSDWNPRTGEGTGFVFDAFDANALAKAIESALRTWRDPVQWRRLQQNGMATDYSWERQILKYVELYKKLPNL
ncbi:MAG: glycogen synthase GlgA [Planctomycetota bacterium]|nr:glycogen synthase GlgA [Planctomycetota bacterium]